jgi:hypothetical protein
MNTTTRFRIAVVFLLALLVLVLAARLGVAIYDEAHPRNVDVLCSDHPDDKNWDRSYHGPADLVLGACQMAYGTNNP